MTQWGLDTLFNPSKRHMDEEKQRLQATREEVGDNSGGERIDISTGKVVIKVAETETSETESAESEEAAESAAVDSSTPAGRARMRRAAMRRKAESGS